jgi:Uma2 family endonuclease
MSTATPPTTSPPKRHYVSQSTFRKFTLTEYHRLIDLGVLIDGEPYELLEGNLVHKMSRGSPHDAAIQALNKRFLRMAPAGWDVRGQSAITLRGESEPEPDLAFVRGDENTYRDHHPGPSEIGLLVEVSASSLLVDRDDKGSIYAQNNIPVYWVVNMVDKVIEVYTQPSGPTEAPAYATCDTFAVGQSLPVVLDGNAVGTVAVADVMG